MKSFTKVALGRLPATLNIGVAIKAIGDFFQRKKKAEELREYLEPEEAEEDAVEKAINAFKECNGLGADGLRCVSNPGDTPIFVCDSGFDLDHAWIPEGYELLKLPSTSGEPTYALIYKILAYIVENKEES